jgi:hypothetical protein
MFVTREGGEERDWQDVGFGGRSPRTHHCCQRVEFSAAQNYKKIDQLNNVSDCGQRDNMGTLEY